MTQVKMVRAKVCLTSDISTFVGYEYSLLNMDSQERRVLYSTLESINPKDLAYHDQEAKRLCRSLIDSLEANSARRGACRDTDLTRSLEDFRNSRPKSF